MLELKENKKSLENILNIIMTLKSWCFYPTLQTGNLKPRDVEVCWDSNPDLLNIESFSFPISIKLF